MTDPVGAESPLSPPGEAADPEDDVRLAESIRTAVLATPGVAAMGGGRLVEAATYWVNRKVMGVVIHPDAIEVHIVVRYPEGLPVTELDGRLRARLEPLAAGRRTDIVFEDLVIPHLVMPDETL